jgi:two-component system nitrogen regulation sensor histidine kinase NtrY
MDARATGSDLNEPPASLRRRLAAERAGGRFYRVVELVTAVLLVIMLATSTSILSRGDPREMLSPPLMALLLVANLIPAIGLMVLFSRRIAMRRAERGGLGTGQLHTRLVALFSVIAAVPTVLVAIFASVLFQAGVEFWFSDRARTVLQQAQATADIYEQEHRERIESDTAAMGADMVRVINEFGFGSPELRGAIVDQLAIRQFREGAVFVLGDDGKWVTEASVNFDNLPIQQSFSPAEGLKLKAGAVQVKIADVDRIEALIRLDPSAPVFMYGAREINAQAVKALRQTRDAANDYTRSLERARALQLQFNVALFLISLVIVGSAIFFALKMADRLVRPLGRLVTAAGRVEEGDFAARVPVERRDDEIGVLAAAFNRMTERVEEQTGALRLANTQLDTRRAFIEAVLGSVTAGVIALDRNTRILLVNRSAEALLQHGEQELDGRPLAELSPELAEFLTGGQREADVLVRSEQGHRTLAVKRVSYADGFVLTFDDITDQLADQRQAAWSDIARRIAHEIRNPLTPIQLAAERLQRRYGKEIGSDPETFGRLTETIIRQVGDLRRMVDEFSNFARMPKPVFREENIHDIARTSLFLHEVAHPAVTFTLEPPAGDIRMVCDRRQLAQALTNIVKNAVEAIESRRNRGEHSLQGDRVALAIGQSDAQLIIDVTDTGVGLPEDRERITEPYMTTRVRGTGLGLAIVKKIVEEHGGEIAFLDRPGGGTHVRIAFDLQRLQTLADASQDQDGTNLNEESA